MFDNIASNHRPLGRAGRNHTGVAYKLVAIFQGRHVTLAQGERTAMNARKFQLEQRNPGTIYKVLPA